MNLNWQMIAACFAALQFIVMGIAFFVIKFNDLHHLHLAVTDIKSHLDKQDKKMNQFELSLTDLTARFQERTKVLKKRIK